MQKKYILPFLVFFILTISNCGYATVKVYSSREDSLRKLVVINIEVGNTNYANIQIKDNGVGIEKSSLSKIFDISKSFYTKGTENELSSGLGLILVQDFVERNNGTLSIESNNIKGTCVKFTLPLFRASKDL